ncbi:putative hydroxymethylglutaryl-CoA lyase [Gordonia alkanivorans NBRC 16433]|uniref:Putative hydroxymethylglutaryl-CoA lyase n=1 Tax=Gordonia alkanivorans NBRC 16433 TaxID=1027371 RepID=F9VVD1_9ACTN|nr:putative hydroxymethylglutaryl-CoA lyase [Gordonia alkanivorans NBRC 16433]
MAAGLRRIEATSFVHPKRVPQMADAEAVSAALPRGEVSWIGLVLNERGLDRAIAAGLDEVNIVVVASDTFSRRNQGTSTDEGVDLWNRLAKRASDAGLKTTVTIAAAFGCPFEGEVPVERVADLLRRCSDVQPDEIALADTIGVGVPAQVVALADAARREAPGMPLRWHFHNTRNTGYANALTALQLGASALDASLGGIGDARSPRPRRATSPPRTSGTSSTAADATPASTRPYSSTAPAGSARCSGRRCRASCPARACFPRPNSRPPDQIPVRESGKTMARGLYIAFTHPRDESVEDEFNEWYTTHHLPEILATEGVTSAVR